MAFFYKHYNSKISDFKERGFVWFRDFLNRICVYLEKNCIPPENAIFYIGRSFYTIGWNMGYFKNKAPNIYGTPFVVVDDDTYWLGGYTGIIIKYSDHKEGETNMLTYYHDYLKDNEVYKELVKACTALGVTVAADYDARLVNPAIRFTFIHEESRRKIDRYVIYNNLASVEVQIISDIKKELIPAVINELEIKDVIFSNPATIVFWTDGTKTVVKSGKGELFDPEKGLAMAVAKKFLGKTDSKYDYYDIFKKWLPAEDEEESNPYAESTYPVVLVSAKAYAARFDIPYKKVLEGINSGKLAANKKANGVWEIPVDAKLWYGEAR